MAALPEEIYQILLEGILAERWAPGSRLPPERKLAVDHSTNRNTLREAIRRLEQSNLVTVRQGQGVTVQDFRAVGTLDLVPGYLKHGLDGAEKAQLILDLLEPRRMILGLLAVRAAERASADDVSKLQSGVERIADCEAKRDSGGAVEAQVAWLNDLVEASRSLATRWITNPLFRSSAELLKERPELILWEPSFAEMAKGVTESISQGRVEQAHQAIADFHLEVDRKVEAMLGPIASARSNRP